MSMARLYFTTTGEWVTSFAREQFFREHCDYGWVETFLLSCLDGTDLDKETLKTLVRDILEGRKQMKGKATIGNPQPDDDYRMEEDIPHGQTIEQELTWRAKKAKLERECLDRDRLEEQRSKRMVEDYLQNAHYEITLGSAYGWLEPNGTFHAVEFGYHQEWARNFLLKEKAGRYVNLTMEEMDRPGDVLVSRGWVLLDNPTMGLAQVTAMDEKMTRAQRDFLFDYYTSRKRGDLAEQYIKED